MQIKTEHTFSPEHEALYRDVFELTQAITQTYPNYSHWYHHTFLNGLKKGKRALIMAKEKGKLVGVALVKNTSEEKKLCTLFVRPENRRQGIGQCLLVQVLQELGQKPLVSVSEQNMASVSSLFKRFKFHLSACKKGIYLPHNTEFYFNDEKADAIRQGLIPVLMARMKQLKRD